MHKDAGAEAGQLLHGIERDVNRLADNSKVFIDGFLRSAVSTAQLKTQINEKKMMLERLVY